MSRLTIAALSILATVTAWVGAGGVAEAHFRLEAPTNWKTMDADGNPQKTGPCGNEAGGTATDMVTPYRPGDLVTITINERIPHPGHYRVALGVNGPGDLPASPTVTTVGTDACGSVPIQNPPVFPVLADGMLRHTRPSRPR